MYLIECGVVRYLYCVTFSGKDMQEKGWVKSSQVPTTHSQEKGWVKGGFYWLPHLPQLVLQEIVCRLSYRSVKTKLAINRVSIDYYSNPDTDCLM